MEIKTITKRLDYSGDFDKVVNAALADGWTLTKREVLQPPAQPNDGTRLCTMLYAELEKRDEETDKTKGANNYKCATCGHLDDCSGYCDSCTKGRKWEAPHA